MQTPGWSLNLRNNLVCFLIAEFLGNDGDATVPFRETAEIKSRIYAGAKIDVVDRENDRSQASYLRFLPSGGRMTDDSLISSLSEINRHLRFIRGRRVPLSLGANTSRLSKTRRAFLLSLLPSLPTSSISWLRNQICMRIIILSG